MKVRVTSVLTLSKQEVWELVQQVPTLVYVCKSWVRLVTKDNLQHLYEGQEIHVIIKPSRRMRSAHYWITVHTVDPNKCYIHTSESGSGVKLLRRSVQIHSIDEASCRLTIKCELHAGVLTLIIAAWIWFYYQLRCLRRHSIIKCLLHHRCEV